MLSFKYLLMPTATAPFGSAADKVQWQFSGNVPQGVHAVIQMVTRRANIERSGGPPLLQVDTFFELWDVDVARQNQVAVMGNGQDEFAWHDQAGPGTKGEWEIQGVARFLPFFDVLNAIRTGEPWQQGVIKGAGSWLYTLTTTPKAWDQFSGQVARVLMAKWNSFPGEAQQVTDTTGSGPAVP
jgi:hypothetical protein